MILTEVTEGGPTCIRDDCSYIYDQTMSTAVYYPSMVNKQGENINPNQNLITKQVRCLSCGKSWTEKWQNGIRIDFQ